MSESEPSKSDDDTSLHVERAVRGDGSSTAWLVAHFQPFVQAQVRLRLGGRARREDVEDIASDVWVIALKRLGEIEARAGRFAPVLVRFLGTTALQSCNNFLRRQIRRGMPDRAPAREDDERPRMDDFSAHTRGVVTIAAGQEVSRLIAACLDRLEADKRDVLVLRLMEQRTNQEIAAILKIPANTIAVRYRRALEALRGALPKKVLAELINSRS
ncbi:MAG: sigma-70 family RNA polymerase sigma factor [Planctomycetota bacterium]